MIISRTIVFSVTLLVITIHIEQSLSCLCRLIKFKCPAPPTCCESGQYALDECGCCLKCAKAELQTCGGANDISGRCGNGLQCLKTCLPCKTVGDAGKPCIFPFEYAGKTYDSCTTRDSDTGQPWCATQVDSDGHVVDNAWGDCLDGCPGTRVECDDKYFSIQEGKCIDVSVPGAIPNWFGAPAVKLLDPTQDLRPAPVCKNKGAAVRLYDNTCRCVRGETALDLDVRGMPRGNCTGLEDDSTDNLDKVWCFLENIRDPLEPESGCYSDTKWSERDGRFWSSLACFQAPDIEGGNKPKLHPGHVNRQSTANQRRKPPTTRRTTRRTTQTTTQPTTMTTVADYIPEAGHSFNFTDDYQYIDYEEYNEDLDSEGPEKAGPVQEDRGFTFIVGETNLPGFDEKETFDNSAEETVIEYVQDTVDLEEVTEAAEISILDDLKDLINEINQQNIKKETTDSKENTIKDKLNAINELDDLFPNLKNLNQRSKPESVESSTTTTKPTGQSKAKSRKVSQNKRKKERSKPSTTTQVNPTETFKANPVTETVTKPAIDSIEKSSPTDKEHEEVSTTQTKIPRRKPKQRKTPQKNKQRKASRNPTTTINNPTTEQRVETATNTFVGPEALEDSAYELYTDQDSDIPTTTTPNFFFGINIDL